MGGFFGITSKRDCVVDVFFGTDYHSHLGTKIAGMTSFDEEMRHQRTIHNIETAPFRTKFDHVLEQMKGCSAIGCISDHDPQPLLMRSELGAYSICIVGVVKNTDELAEQYMADGNGQFTVMTSGVFNTTELVAALISQKDTFAEGTAYICRLGFLHQ